MNVTPLSRILLRSTALLYLFVLLVLPIALILWRTFGEGLGAFVDSISTPAAISALNLSLLIVAIVVPLNVSSASSRHLRWCVDGFPAGVCSKASSTCRSPCRPSLSASH